jgi:hypothetical protein
MLKLTYTETGLHMERVAAPLEVLVAQRVVLALSFGQTLYVERGKASFLLSASASGLAQLEQAVRTDANLNVCICPIDDQFVEISVEGSWIAETTAAHEGTFVTALSDRVEFYIFKLWQTTQVPASFLA